jgi:integrase
MRRSEVEAMAQAIRSDSSYYGKLFYPLFFVLANFGLRISEAVYLTKDDFRDLEAGFFHVHRKKKERYSKERNKRKPNRRVMDFVYVNRREREVLSSIVRPMKNQRIFPLSVRAAQELFAHYLRLANLRLVYTPHCLRRFVAVEMDELGISKVAIKARLGHALDTTELYQANPDKMLREIEKWRPIE